MEQHSFPWRPGANRAETALRLPGVIFGALTAILIYLMAAELFALKLG